MKLNYVSIALTFILLSVARIFAASGDIDTTFGNSGFVNFSETMVDMMIQPDDKIVVAGNYQDQYGYYNIIRRYNPDGSPDTSFGFFGATGVYTDWGINSAALQSDGGILVAGYMCCAPSGVGYQFFVKRFLSNGTVDSSFGDNGTSFAQFLPGSVTDALLNDVAVRADGKIVAAGYIVPFNQLEKFSIARFNANGTLDNSFSDNGKVILDWGNESMANTLAFKPNGKTLVGGQTFANGKWNFALAQLNNNGTLDSNFGTAGKVITNFGNQGSLKSITVQPNGKIIVTGADYAESPDQVFCNSDVALARYNSNGSLDDTFGTGGKTKLHLSFYCGSVSYSSFLQPDGKIIVVGAANAPTAGNLLVARFNPSGSLDTSFGNDGKVTLASFIYNTDKGRSGGIQSNGKIIALSYKSMVRFLP